MTWIKNIYFCRFLELVSRHSQTQTITETSSKLNKTTAELKCGISYDDYSVIINSMGCTIPGQNQTRSFGTQTPSDPITPPFSPSPPTYPELPQKLGIVTKSITNSEGVITKFRYYELILTIIDNEGEETRMEMIVQENISIKSIAEAIESQAKQYVKHKKLELKNLDFISKYTSQVFDQSEMIKNIKNQIEGKDLLKLYVHCDEKILVYVQIDEQLSLISVKLEFKNPPLNNTEIEEPREFMVEMDKKKTISDLRKHIMSIKKLKKCRIKFLQKINRVEKQIEVQREGITFIRNLNRYKFGNCVKLYIRKKNT